MLFAGYHVPPGPAADYAAVELISVILGDTPSGRLHKRLTEKQLAAKVEQAVASDLADRTPGRAGSTSEIGDRIAALVAGS